MGGGDGTIIVRDAMKSVLTNPVVHGKIPKETTRVIDPVLEKDVGEWSVYEHRAIVDAFTWVATH